MQRGRNSRRRRRRLRIFGRRVDIRRLVPFAFFLVLFVVSAAMLVDYGVHSLKRKSENNRLAENYEEAFSVGETMIPMSAEPEAVQTAAPTAEPVATPAPTAEPTLAPAYHTLSGTVPQKAQGLYRQNNDLVGWLYIKGVASLPVVQRDNEFYLNHGFDGKPSDGGTLFLDEYHPMAEDTQNFLIHGHNMYDSSMFGIVSTYNKLSMVKNSGFARFSTMYAPEDYVICAVLRVSPDPSSERYLPYVGRAKFADEAQFLSFVNELQARSMFNIPVDVQPYDALLSLSTCIDDDRLLVVFRRVREGETKDALQALLNRTVKK